MNKKINITEIARESGYSIASVSRVLNGKNGVSEGVRKKITAILDKHNYVLDSHLARERKVALLCGNNQFGSYVDKIFEGIYEYSVENGLSVTMLFKNDTLKTTILEQIREQQCSGVIIVLPFAFRNGLDELADSELPVILIDDVVYKDGLGFIGHDASSGACEAVNHLLSLGHRNIGYIEYSVETFDHLQRIKAYENTLRGAGIEPKPQWHVKTSPNESLWRGAYLKMKELLETAPELTAVMTTSDSLAMGAIKAVFDSGRKVPEDISVVGFDNYRELEYLHPALTTVNHPMKEIGYMAMEEIDLYLKSSKERALPREIFPTKLIIRESTCAPEKSLT